MTVANIPKLMMEQGNLTTDVPVSQDNLESSYHLKWIPWNTGKIPIVMQSMNGPCPLIATMNVLLLRENIKLPSMLEQITVSQLLAYLAEKITDCVPPDIPDMDAILNFEQNVSDAIDILPRLEAGLDVNIKFTGITHFEYTPECVIFDILRIPLYHGWLIDPDSIELKEAIGQRSYNQVVDLIITNETTNDSDLVSKKLIAQEFLNNTASQLTYHGLHKLRTEIRDNEIGILFRNNHFLTLHKRDGEIFTLVTDHGYLTEENIVWETLDSIEGAGRFFDANFKLSETTNLQIDLLQEIEKKKVDNSGVADVFLEPSTSAVSESSCQIASPENPAPHNDPDVQDTNTINEQQHQHSPPEACSSSPKASDPADVDYSQTSSSSSSNNNNKPSDSNPQLIKEYLESIANSKPTTHSSENFIGTIADRFRNQLEIESTEPSSSSSSTGSQPTMQQYNPQSTEQHDQYDRSSQRNNSYHQSSLDGHYRPNQPPTNNHNHNTDQQHQNSYTSIIGPNTNRRGRGDKMSKESNCNIC